MYLSCFPRTVHETASPSLPGVPSAWFPRFIGTTKRSEFLTVVSPHFVSFAWRYLGTPAFRPRSAADAGPTDHPGVCCTGCSRSGFLQGTVRISQVPGEPVDHSPCSSDPGVTRRLIWVRVKSAWRGPRVCPGRGLTTMVISGLNHTAFDLAVYASRGTVSRPDARLASGCWPGSAGRGWLPAGFR